MTYKGIATMISTVGIPYAYDHFPEGTGVAPPFIAFYFDESNDLAADNTNWQRIDNLIIELYTNNKDFELEASIESTLNSNGLVFVKVERYIDSEKMFEVIYSTNVVITEVSSNG